MKRPRSEIYEFGQCGKMFRAENSLIFSRYFECFTWSSGRTKSSRYVIVQCVRDSMRILVSVAATKFVHTRELSDSSHDPSSQSSDSQLMLIN